MQDLSLHLLDVVENALAAGADRVEIRIVEAAEEDIVRIEIQDNGRGMDEETARHALDPFYTTKPGKRVGLGLPLLAQAAREAGGQMEIDTEPGKGTLVRATFQLSHPDLKPIGDMLQTMSVLKCCNPGVHFTFDHVRNEAVVARCSSQDLRSDKT